MILEPSNYDFWTEGSKKLEIFSKIIGFNWLDTAKHGFLYDRMILEHSNYDFWTLRAEKPLAGIIFKYHSF